MRWLAVASALSVPVLFFPHGPPVASAQTDDAPGSVTVTDDQTLFRLYREAAENGDPAAQAVVAGMYAAGENVPRDYAEAAKWYRMAADRGHADAQYNLGTMYAGGQGVTQDPDEAAKWCRMAAEQGHADAQFDLAAMYESGKGVSRDRRFAYMWLELAAEGFLREEDRAMARETRDRLAARMTPAQVNEARELVREWNRKKAEN